MLSNFLYSQSTTLLSSSINFYVLCCDIKVVFHMSVHSSNLCSEKEPGVCMHVWHGKDREREEIINRDRMLEVQLKLGRHLLVQELKKLC